MPDDYNEVRFEELKKKLLMCLMRSKFEENITKEFEKKNFKSLDEMDKFISDRLYNLLEEQDMVRKYYDEKISELKGRT